MVPTVKLHEWIRIGTSGRTDGLVLDIHTDGSLGIGYYQNRLKAIKDTVVWDGECWRFKYDGPSGSYLRGAEEAMVKRGPYGS